MSWVKKFQEGGKSTKQYGHLRINGVDLGNSEEMYNAFARHAQRQDIRQGKFYDQWLEMLRNGEDVEFGNGNTVNAKPNDMSERRASERSNWTRFWDDVFDTDRNQFSNAVATARRFNWAPLKVEETPVSKKDFDTSTIKLNYNPDPKNKKRQTWSTTHADNARAEKRVADALAWMADPSKFDYNDNENIAAAYSRANANGDPNTFAENIWNVMRNYQGLDFTDPDVQNALDWLNAFGIDVDRSTVPAGNSGGSSGGTSVTKEFKGPDGKIYISDKDGNLTLKAGQDDTPTVKQEVPIVDPTTKIDNSKPTLITRKFAIANGLSSDYWYGVYYNGKPYSVADINNNPGLKLIMDEVARINNQTNLTQQERIKALSDRINIPYENFSTYGEWNPAYTVDGLNLGEELGKRGVTSAAISEYEPTSDGSRIFKYYNNTEPGENPWNFRSEYYLVYDKDGNLYLTTNDEKETLFNNAGVGDLKVPNFIQNALGTINLTYTTPQIMTMQSTAGAFPYSKQVSGNGDFYLRREKDGKQLVQDKSGKYYIYNPKNQRLVQISDEAALRFDKGGKIDFNKVNAFAKGGKVAKAQNGLSALDGALLQQINRLKSNDFTVRDNLGNIKWFSDTYSNFFQIPEVADPNSGIRSQVNTPVPDVKASTEVTDTKRSSLYSDYNLDSSPYITAGINSGLAALDYGSMAWGRRKIHDITERAIKDSIYKQTTPQLQTLPVTTPLEDRLAKMYESHIGRMKLPQTSDTVTNTSLEFTDDAQAMQGLSQAVGQKSAKVTQLQQANQQTINQQQQYYANAENDLRQRVAGAIMNLGQNDASLVAQTAQSIQNLAREWRTKFDNANQQFNLFQYQNKINELNRQADADWLNQVQTAHPDIWAQWDAADQSKYDHDFNTWAMSQKGIWNKLENDYRANQEAISGYAGDAYLNYRLNDPFLRSLYRNRYAVARKSGGKITTKRQNRYKNEPSEDIWIEQNKSTHKLVAKLNDNIIKTFLKTLK